MADPSALSFATPAHTLVGRERELATLHDALASALAGRGSLVLIGGEAGIGKTALAETMFAQAEERGAAVLVGRCYDLSETAPYGPWAEALARLAPPPEVVTVLSGAATVASQSGLFARVREALAERAARHPLVLLLDDLHWADPASLALLRTVARELAPLPMLILALYRTEELTRQSPLFPLFPVLIREAAALRLDLQVLGDIAIREWLHARYRLADPHAARLVAYIQARAEGNPFFAGELLRALEETGLLRAAAGGVWALGDLAGVSIPPLLRQVLSGRVGRLGEGARVLLAMAAVIGQEVPLALWAAVAETDEDGLLGTIERAVDARLLLESPDGSGVRFAHALIREALYAGTLALRRRHVHRRVAEALAAAASPDVDAIAHHFQLAGDARAVAWLVRAGDRANRAYAWLTAEARYAAALALLEGGDAAATERAWLLLRLVAIQQFADPARALATLGTAQEVIRSAADPLLDAYALYLAGYLHCFTGMVGPGVRELAAGVAGLEALSSAQRDQLFLLSGRRTFHDNKRGSLALWQAHSGQYAAARATGERVEATSVVADPSAYVGLGLACAALGDPALARRAFQRAVAEYRTVGHHFMVAAALDERLVAVEWPYHGEERAERAHLVADLVAAAGAMGDAVAAPAAAMLGRTLLLEGRWDELRRAGETPFLWAANGQFHLLAPWTRVLALGGESERAWAAIRRFLPEGPATAPGEALFIPATELQRVAFALALDAGDLPAAREWLRAHDRWVAWSAAVLWRSEGRALWARYHRAAGDPALARRHAEAALAHATEPRQPLALLAVHRLLGELDTDAGRHADAARHLDAALALAEACAVPYERALTLLAQAELRAASDDEAGARLLLAEVCATCAPLGAAPALARAEALTARLDTAPVVSTPAPAGLTVREVEVLRLLAGGASNRAIAAALFLSPHTVERHVANLYVKTGAHSRAEATAFARRHRLA